MTWAMTDSVHEAFWRGRREPPGLASHFANNSPAPVEGVSERTGTGSSDFADPADCKNRGAPAELQNERRILVDEETRGAAFLASENRRSRFGAEVGGKSSSPPFVGGNKGKGEKITESESCKGRTDPAGRRGSKQGNGGKSNAMKGQHQLASNAMHSTAKGVAATTPIKRPRGPSSFQVTELTRRYRQAEHLNSDRYLFYLLATTLRYRFLCCLTRMEGRTIPSVAPGL